MNGENGMKQKGAASHTVANANDGMPANKQAKKEKRNDGNDNTKSWRLCC